eukprot:2767703-Prymnesium_polylepis.2
MQERAETSRMYINQERVIKKADRLVRQRDAGLLHLIVEAHQEVQGPRPQVHQSAACAAWGAKGCTSLASSRVAHRIENKPAKWGENGAT